MKNRLVAALTIIGALLVGSVTYAAATKPPVHKVTLCHRTASHTNPYVVVNVDVASVKFVAHAEQHSGPVFFPGIAKHVEWGDIIPAFSTADGYPFDYPGKNLADGASILANGCGIPGEHDDYVDHRDTNHADDAERLPGLHNDHVDFEYQHDVEHSAVDQHHGIHGAADTAACYAATGFSPGRTTDTGAIEPRVVTKVYRLTNKRETQH